MITKYSTDNEKNIKIIYNDLYKNEDFVQNISFYKWLLRMINMDTDSRALDVSCGSGELLSLLSDETQSVGVDISVNALKRAKKVTGSKSRAKINLLLSEGENLPFKTGSFHYVTNIGSLEHFVDPNRGLAEMYRVLKPKGKAFILVPNLFALFPNIQHIIRTGQLSFDDQPIQRYACNDGWYNLIEESGLEIYQVIRYERIFPSNRSDWHALVRQPKELVHALISPLIPFNLSWCFLYLCQKA